MEPTTEQLQKAVSIFETMRHTFAMNRLKLDDIYERVSQIDPSADNRKVFAAIRTTFLRTIEHVVGQNRDFEKFLDHISLLAMEDPRLGHGDNTPSQT